MISLFIITNILINIRRGISNLLLTWLYHDDTSRLLGKHRNFGGNFECGQLQPNSTRDEFYCEVQVIRLFFEKTCDIVLPQEQ